jgi:hypothetical protein
MGRSRRREASTLSSLLKNAFLAFFNLAKSRAELAAARKTNAFQTFVLASHPCDDSGALFFSGLLALGVVEKLL